MVKNKRTKHIVTCNFQVSKTNQQKTLLDWIWRFLRAATTQYCQGSFAKKIRLIIIKILPRLHKIVINSWKSWLDVIDIYHWCLYHNLVDSILSDCKSRNWDHWHLIWQNKKSSRGTFGLWGNILSGSLRLLPKHFLPTPVPEPLDKKYQVWIWGSAF